MLGVPVLCSDLPALREVGGGVPDYLDPLDGPGWRRAILDYAGPDSPRRAAQLDRLRGWQAPDWETHFTLVEEMLERVTGAPAPHRPPLPAAQGTPALRPARLGATAA